MTIENREAMEIGFEKHDHGACVSGGLERVIATCLEKGLQFTPVRRRVLEILLERHRAMGAYEILDVLRAEKLGSQPPVVYRALDFLMSNGFAHKIERVNAYTACTHIGVEHAPAFLICTLCDAVVETQSEMSKEVLSRAANDTGFAISRVVIEAEGQCPKCQEVTHDTP
jgi:Fur family zinc uptake transcriptional regulator